MRKIGPIALCLLTFACTGPTDPYMDLNANGTMEPYEDPGLSPGQRADDLLARMSTADKVNLVVGIGFTMPGRMEPIQELRVPGAVGSTYALDSLGIPGLIVTDGPAGVRLLPIEGKETYYCTAFPIASLVSSTWDLALAEEVGTAMGNEVKEYGMDVLLGPALNIHRDPRGGRNFEYFSEDPLLSGKMAAAVVRGVQSQGIGTSIKHFAVNNQETNRMTLDVVVSKRALREIYLRGFEIAVREAQPWTVMSSYNLINGLEASQNPDLLQQILRDEWGFEGMVMTDWFGGVDPVAQMKAGNDLLMPGMPRQRELLMEAIENGALDEETLNRNAKRILRTLIGGPSFNRYEYSNQPDLEAHAALARRVAAEGAVLLKNDGVLPFESEDLKIAAFGNGSYDFISGGTGSGDVVEAYTVNLVEGLRNAGIEVNRELESRYMIYIEEEKAKNPQEEFSFMPPKKIDERYIGSSEIRLAADTTDLALITLGRISGEFEDRPLGGDFYLSKEEIRLIDLVSDEFHKRGKKVVMILNIGNVVDTDSWKDKVDAVLLPWQGGQEAGNAVADVLTGRVNPSGKLPTSFPLVYEDVPSAKNFPGEVTGEAFEMLSGFPSTPGRVFYEEGIYVGYRYYGTFGKDVSYPFGHGLSYTRFSYNRPELTSVDGKVNVRVEVSNIGTVPGKEVVQAYVHAPRESMDKPELELRAFGKTRLLQPGESETLEFVLGHRDLASYDSGRSCWVAEAGTYEVRVGASSEDIRGRGTFELEEEQVVEQLGPALEPRLPLDELR